MVLLYCALSPLFDIKVSLALLCQSELYYTFLFVFYIYLDNHA